MTLNNRKEALTALGKLFGTYVTAPSEAAQAGDALVCELEEAVATTVVYNKWFNKEDMVFCLRHWASLLTRDKIDEWLSHSHFDTVIPKKVVIINEEEVPLAEFHDLLSVLIAGHDALLKRTAQNRYILEFLYRFFEKKAPQLAEHLLFYEEKLTGYDAVIAVKRKDTAGHFKRYFSSIPHLISTPKSTVAVLSGRETPADLEKLGGDIFRYYGLGSESVSKLFVPEGYDFKDFFEAVYPWNFLVNDHRYAGNYDYNKAVYLMSEFALLDNGFLILKEDPNCNSPIACLFYEYYKEEEDLRNTLHNDPQYYRVVEALPSLAKSTGFGQAHLPELTDSVSGEDILKFLSKI